MEGGQIGSTQLAVSASVDLEFRTGVEPAPIQCHATRDLIVLPLILHLWVTPVGLSMKQEPPSVFFLPAALLTQERTAVFLEIVFVSRIFMFFPCGLFVVILNTYGNPEERRQ